MNKLKGRSCRQNRFVEQKTSWVVEPNQPIREKYAQVKMGSSPPGFWGEHF